MAGNLAGLEELKLRDKMTIGSRSMAFGIDLTIHLINFFTLEMIVIT